VKLCDVPAVVGEGKPARMRELAAAGLTVTVTFPVMDAAASVAVRPSLPAALRVALKECTPASDAVKV
jgi:hypothetical protein